MKLRGLGRIKKAAKRLSRKGSPKAVALIYHRVTDAEYPGYQLHVSPSNFKQHLELFQEYSPCSLSQLASSLQLGQLQDRSVVITFDDGYADNLHYALPLLESFQTPATIFITTGYLDSKREFWWDELASYVWSLKDASLAVRLHPDWNALSNLDDNWRFGLFEVLHKQLKNLDHSHRSAALHKLWIDAGLERSFREEHRQLTSDEIRKLDENPLIEIGAHTVHHPRLSSLTDIEQLSEITRSSAELDALLGHVVRSFAYPFGRKGDLSANTHKLVQQSGLTCACTVYEELIWPDTDPLLIPRFNVQDWKGAELRSKLEEWLRK